LSFLGLLTLLPYLINGSEPVRVRNALLFSAGGMGQFEWTPLSLPPDYRVETGPIDPLFADLVVRLGLKGLPSDWDRVVAIEKHLLESPEARGPAIQADLRTTYRQIVVNGRGYCADFVRVFRALATAAGMPVRSWAFSFDGFGGHGHVWMEFWDRRAGQWQLIDVFDNYYFTDGGRRLSALEFRHALESRSPTLRLALIAEHATPGYVHEEKAWDYFRRGLPEWYLMWANIPFSYEADPLVRWLSPISRSAAQGVAVLRGLQPKPYLLATEVNRPAIRALRLVRLHVEGVMALWAISLLAFLYGIWLPRRLRSRKLRCQCTA
jgi:hypothetical protein